MGGVFNYFIRSASFTLFQEEIAVFEGSNISVVVVYQYSKSEEVVFEDRRGRFLFLIVESCF